MEHPYAKDTKDTIEGILRQGVYACKGVGMVHAKRCDGIAQRFLLKEASNASSS